MSAIKKSNSFFQSKQNNSWSTESNTQDFSNSSLQINPIKTSKHNIQPKKSIKISNQDATGTNSPLTPASMKKKHLLEVPYLPIKQLDNSLLRSKNIDEMNKRNMLSPRQASIHQSHDQSIRDTNLSNILSCLNEAEKSAHLISQELDTKSSAIKSRMFQTPSFKDKVAKNAEVPLSSVKLGQKHILKRYTSLNDLDFEEESKIDIDVEEQEQSKLCCTDLGMKNSLRETEVVVARPVKNNPQKISTPLNSKENKLGTLKKSDKGGSRLTLRDYMYQTQISSKKMLDELKQQSDESRLLKDQSMHNLQMTKKATFSSPQYKTNKYGISNSQMFDVLRKDINDEIINTISHLKELQERLSQVVTPESPSEDDLSQLYSVRRDLKQKIGAETVRMFRQIIPEQRQSGRVDHKCSSQLLLKQI